MNSLFQKRKKIIDKNHTYRIEFYLYNQAKRNLVLENNRKRYRYNIPWGKIQASAITSNKTNLRYSVNLKKNTIYRIKILVESNDGQLTELTSNHFRGAILKTKESDDIQWDLYSYIFTC